MFDICLRVNLVYPEKNEAEKRVACLQKSKQILGCIVCVLYLLRRCIVILFYVRFSKTIMIAII